MHDPLTDAYLAPNAWGGRLVVRLDHQRGYFRLCTWRARSPKVAYYPLLPRFARIMGRGRPRLFGCALCRRLENNPGKLPSDFHVSHDKDCPLWVKGMGPLAARKRKFGGGAADASPLTAKPLVVKT